MARCPPFRPHSYLYRLLLLPYTCIACALQRRCLPYNSETYRTQLDAARNHIILVNLWISVWSIAIMVRCGYGTVRHSWGLPWLARRPSGSNRMTAETPESTSCVYYETHFLSPPYLNGITKIS